MSLNSNVDGYFRIYRDATVEAQVAFDPRTANDGLALNLGTGAFMLGPPTDLTNVGGNARGDYAVDLQAVRANPDEVAAAARSAIVGGQNNQVDAGSDGAAIVGGTGNTVSGIAADDAFMGGGNGNLASGLQSVCVGGSSHVSSGQASICAGGDDNDATNTNAGCFAGSANNATGGWSVCLGGNSNTTTSGARSAIVAGQSNNCTGNDAVVVGGTNNRADAAKSVTLGGNFNDCNAVESACLAGILNDADAAWSVCIGGTTNQTLAAYAVAMGAAGLADHPSTFVWSGNSEGTGTGDRGESQGQLVHLDQRTTTAVPTTMDSAGTQLGINVDNTAFGITGKVVAWNESDTTMTTWVIDVDVYRAGAALTFLGGNGAQVISRTDDLGTPALSIGSTGTTINFDITGLAKNIRWSATLIITRANH